MSSNLPTSGPISFSEIQRILGGENPISLSEYYANAAGGYSAGVPGIPLSGVPIPVSAFRGKAKLPVLVPVAVGTIPEMNLTDGTKTVVLATYFAGPDLMFSVTTDPHLNATIADGVLSVTGAYRDTSYTVQVQATNTSGSVATQNVSVTEGAPVVVVTQLMDLAWTENGADAATTPGANVYSSDPIQYGSVASVFNQTGSMRTFEHIYDLSGNYIGSTSTTLSDGQIVKGAYFHIRLDNAALFTTYTVPSNWSNDDVIYDNMAEWYILGSITGSEGSWSVLDYHNTDGLHTETLNLVLQHPGSYNCYRFLVSRTGGTKLQTTLYMPGFSMSV